jgi:hypothetical protein
MAVTADDVRRLVEEQLKSIIDSPRRAEIEGFLLAVPVKQMRGWDYGGAHEFPCWVITRAVRSTLLASCEVGFGPRNPWGMLFEDESKSMGMDCGWYSSLEDAFIESPMSDGPRQEDYEVR